MINCLIQHFEADFLWQPQNPELRNNCENVSISLALENQISIKTCSMPTKLYQLYLV